PRDAGGGPSPRWRQPLAAAIAIKRKAAASPPPRWARRAARGGHGHLRRFSGGSRGSVRSSPESTLDHPDRTPPGRAVPPRLPFVIRNVGNLVPPFEPDAGFHGTSAGIEFATLVLEVKDIVVCGHSDCGTIRALFAPLRADAPHITRWLELARPALVDLEMTEANLRRTEMRSVVLQLERLMSFPMVRERVERGALCLH